LTKTNEELYILATDFLINAKFGTNEETEVITKEIISLSKNEHEFFLGFVSGFIFGILNLTLIGDITEPMLKEFFRQNYLEMKKQGKFED